MTLPSAQKRTEPFDLRRERINAGLSLKGFARRLQVPEGTLRRLEAGLPVRPESVKPVADFFDVDVLDVAPGLLGDVA